MTLTPEGVMEWNPETSEVGNSPSVAVTITILKDGQSIYEATRTYQIQVLSRLPQLAEIAPRTTYEAAPLGWNVISFADFQPGDEDRARFRWSLVAPPPGVSIDSQGGLHWPDDRGYSRTEPYTFTVRIDYETLNGWLSDEVTCQHRVLPQPASTNYGELVNYSPQLSGMLGYSVVAGGGWLAAGEPAPGTPNAGRVRLWKWSERNGTYYDHLSFQPEFVIDSQAFGASLSIAAADFQNPLRIAVGAPSAGQFGNSDEILSAVGAVHVYACDANGTWRSDATLNPPVARQSLEFGSSVSIEGDLLVAGMPGMNSQGYDTGALAVFRHHEAGWEFSQTIEAAAPAWGDRFGEVVDAEGEWIAAAAPGDDDMGNNGGAVHLYRSTPSGYAHHQVIHAPAPEADARFGERLLMTGPWLFVSSFREHGNTGAVHVFKENGGTWSYQQSLVSPFATEGSAFGMAMSCSQGVLAISSPGYLFDDSGIDGSNAPWKGITLFELSGDSWQWSRQVTESPDGSSDPHTWGFSLAQVGAGMTIAGIPDSSPGIQGKPQLLAGRLFIHRWPARLTDPFPGALAGLPAIDGQPAGPEDDSNHNGVPNILDWMMGSNPGTGPDWWTAKVPLSKQPFVRLNPLTGETDFMIPELQDGMNRRVDIEVSEDLSTWTTVENARWGPLAEVYFKGDDGSNYLTYFHPVLIPSDGEETPKQRFFRWSVRED